MPPFSPLDLTITAIALVMLIGWVWTTIRYRRSRTKADTLSLELAQLRQQVEQGARLEVEYSQLRENWMHDRSQLATYEERLRHTEALDVELGRVRQAFQDEHAEAEKLRERLDQESRRLQETRALLDSAEQRLADTFKSLSKDVLDQNNGQFLKLAEQAFKQLQQQAVHEFERKQTAVDGLVKPIGESLSRVQESVSQLEKQRRDAYGSLRQQMDELLKTHLPRLHKETENLVKALRQPTTRGRWGEVQLRRVVEMAGMTEHCDFNEQVSHEGDSGRLRPDLVVRLPGERLVVVDAKVPLEAYLQAVEAEDEGDRLLHLNGHARQLKQHMQQLAHKNYFDQFERAPEFVVLFMPGEAFFSAALHADPGLIEYGVVRKVIPASPTTLIALLKAVAYGWQQEAMTRNAERIASLGKELYQRAVTVAEHWNKLGTQLERTILAYNQATASLDSRLLVTARKFQELRQLPDADALTESKPVEQTVRLLRKTDGGE